MSTPFSFIGYKLLLYSESYHSYFQMMNVNALSTYANLECWTNLKRCVKSRDVLFAKTGLI